MCAKDEIANSAVPEQTASFGLGRPMCSNIGSVYGCLAKDGHSDPAENIGQPPHMGLSIKESVCSSTL